MAGRGHRDIAAADIEWREGQSSGIRFAMFSTDASRANAPAIVLSTFEPGQVIAPHTHDSNYFEYIVSGEQTVGKTRFGAGDVRIVAGGTGYGPIHIGPEGCSVLIVFEDRSGAQTVSLPRSRAPATAQG